MYPNSFSDHELIGVIRKLHIQKYRTILTRDYSQYNIEVLKSELRNISWLPILSENDTNKSWCMFKQQLSSIVEKHAPMKEKRIRGKDCPWLTNAIRRDMKERDCYLTKARNQNNKEDWALYRRYRNLVTASIRHKKANYNKNLLQEHSNEPKQFWTTIKKCYPTKSKSNTNPTFIVNGDKLENQSIANGFCTFFTNIGSLLLLFKIAYEQIIIK